MRRRLFVLTAWSGLTIGAPAQQNRGPAPQILSFTLDEREPALIKKIGPPEHFSAGDAYRTLDYTFDQRSDEDFDWTFYFSLPGGAMISVTRNFVKPTNIANLLGPGARRHTFRNGSSTLAALSRELPGDRILIAIGLTTPESPCSQIVLMRRSALSRFYPWIDRDLR